MSTPTRSATNSLAKDSEVRFASNAGARLRVSAVTATTIDVDSVAELTNIALYSASKPGQVEILSCASAATHQGKTTLVTGISGVTLTVSVDFSAFLAVGDIIDCVPPGSVKMSLSGGHTLQSSLENDYTMGLQDTFNNHNTTMGAKSGGDVPFFQGFNSEGFARMLAFGIGSYKTFRSVTDGATTSGSAVVTSATAAFSSSDVGHAISGSGIPASTTILTVDSATQVTMSANATATAAGVTVTIGAAGTHYYRPIEANDGAFTTMEDGTFYVQDGNGALRRHIYGAMGTRLTLDWPQNATATGSVTCLGNGANREIGGSGKVFLTGANNYLRTDLVCDVSPRVTFRSAFVEFGGAYRDALTSAASTSMQNLTLTIERGTIEDPTLGDAWIVKPEEDTFIVKVTGTGILNADDIFEKATGGANDAEPGSGAKTETRMLIKAVLPGDATKTLTIDMPRGVFSTESTARGRGRYKQNFEFTALATLDPTTGCESTSTPVAEIRLISSVVKNLATQI